jgi:ribosomal protein S18 acetylase RimI-like enzyme
MNDRYTELETLADANYIESIREHARWQQPCEVVEAGGLLMVAGVNGNAGSYKNCVARLEASLSPVEVLKRARAFFGPRSRPFTLFVRMRQDADLDRFLEHEGIARISDAPCMLVDAPLPAPSLSAGVRVQRFREKEHIHDAASINADAFAALKLPPEETHLFFSHPDRLLSERLIGFVAYRDTQPLATALAILSGDGAGIYWVGTATGSQRSGLGTLCTRLATNAAFEAGARVVTLQASPYGEPVYVRLGFRTYDRTRWYRHNPA